MSLTCDFILHGNVTPEQLAALGAALGRWCGGTARGTGVDQYFGGQTLADLIAGKLPGPGRAPGPTERRGLSFRVRDGASPDRQAAIDRLRREIPAEGVEDILVDGKSWHRLG